MVSLYKVHPGGDRLSYTQVGRRRVTAMLSTPFMIWLLAGALGVLGLLIIRSALRPARSRVCRAAGCGHANPIEAAYCARCGEKLTGARSSVRRDPPA